MRIRGYFSQPTGVREQRSLGNTGLAVSLLPATTVLGLNQGQFGWELQWSKCYWDRVFSSNSAYFCQHHSPILRTPIHSFINGAVFVFYQSTASLNSNKIRWKSVVTLKSFCVVMRLDGPQKSLDVWGEQTLRKKCGSYFEILAARRVTWSRFHSEYPQILRTVVQNLVAFANRRPRSVHHCSTFRYRRRSFISQRAADWLCQPFSGTWASFEAWTYLLTHSMVQSPSWEANWFANSQEIPRISRSPKVHYRTHKRPPPVPIQGQPNPVHIPTSHLLEIIPNIIHPSTPTTTTTTNNNNNNILYLQFPPNWWFSFLSHQETSLFVYYCGIIHFNCTFLGAFTIVQGPF